jgi:RNA polymerase sigma factor (sigma-70 family)
MRSVSSGSATRLGALSDEALVERARTGDDLAFAEIVRRYREPLRRYCARRVGIDHAEDVVQHAFERAIVHLRSDPRPMRPRVWLYRVAHNKAAHVAERKDFSWEPLPPDLDGVPQPPEVVAGRARFQRCVAEIASLPERQRRALVLRALDGYEYAQIAAALGTSSERVRGLIARARARLRRAAIAVLPLPLLRWGPGGAGAAPAVGGSGIAMAGAKLAAFAAAAAVAGAGVGGSAGLVPRAEAGETRGPAPTHDLGDVGPTTTSAQATVRDGQPPARRAPVTGGQPPARTAARGLPRPAAAASGGRSPAPPAPSAQQPVLAHGEPAPPPQAFEEPPAASADDAVEAPPPAGEAEQPEGGADQPVVEPDVPEKAVEAPTPEQELEPEPVAEADGVETEPM